MDVVLESADLTPPITEEEFSVFSAAALYHLRDGLPNQCMATDAWYVNFTLTARGTSDPRLGWEPTLSEVQPLSPNIFVCKNSCFEVSRLEVRSKEWRCRVLEHLMNGRLISLLNQPFVLCCFVICLKSICTCQVLLP